MKKTRNFGLNIVLIVGFTAFVLWFTLKDNYREVLQILQQISPGWLIVILAIVLLYQWVIGWILTQLTRISNPHYRLRYGVVNALVASFFHGVTPSASGGQFAQVYVFKKQGVQLSDSASVLWMEFIVYQSVMIVTVFVLLLLRFHYFYAHYSQFFLLVLLGFLVNSLVIVGLWALVRFPRIYRWLSTRGLDLGCRLHLVKDPEKARAMLKDQLDRFGSETTKLKSHRPLIIRVVIANFVRLGLYYSIPFFCALALNLPIGPELFLDCVALASFVSMINAFIPIPGASGGTEATFVLMFSTVFGRLGATSAMILWRFVSYYLIMILGGLTFIWVKSRLAVVVSRKEGHE